MDRLINKGLLITHASVPAGSPDRERESELRMAAECAFDQLLISKVQQLQHLQHSPLALATIAHRMPWENCEKNKVIFENVALKYGATA